MASLEYTPIVPTLAGTAFTTTPANIDDGDEYVYMPISATMHTLVVITNTDASPHTVTFTSQADEWGNTGASLDKAVTIGANKTYITGVWLRNRWGEKDTPTTGKYDCIISYDVSEDIKMAVINVPSVSKD